MEIIEIISEHSDYVEYEPMTIFYCLYFCIYYKNSHIVTFLKTLIQKVRLAEQHEMINLMLQYIDDHGLDRLRTVGENINT